MTSSPLDAAPAPSEPCVLRLRVAFEASSLRRARAVAAEIERLVGESSEVRPAAALRASVQPSIDSWTWSIVATTRELSLTSAELHMWERKMLALEYKLPGSRFLGWTTTSIPAISDRRSSIVPVPAEEAGLPSRSQQEAGLPLRSQRNLVAESLLRRPSEGPSAAGYIHPIR